MNDLLPSPEVLKGLGYLAALLFIRDLSFASLRRLKAKVKATPSTDDDWLADLADVAMGVLSKIPLPSLVKKK